MRVHFETALNAHLADLSANFAPHSRLAAAVQYSLTIGGKRLRPILVLETCRVCGGLVDAAMPAALAIECVHTFSLIHDDLPAMDDDDTRRGKPTNHKVFGDGLAILAGDWLVTHAFGLLLSGRYDRNIAGALVQTLADGTRGMIEGQAADLAGEEQSPDPELVQFIHQRKTAALLEACCRLGALCAGASGDQVCALARFGKQLGLAFQIMDDVLDVTSSAEQMGKRVGKDDAARKQTYPAAFGLEESRLQAAREVEAALAALDSFGDCAERLRDLARYVIQRDH